MQPSQPVVLAGGHEKHFRFLPGGERLTKSGVREVKFYMWLYQLAGKPLPCTTSVDEFLKKEYRRSDRASREAKVKRAAGGHEIVAASRQGFCKAERVECLTDAPDAETLRETHTVGKNHAEASALLPLEVVVHAREGNVVGSAAFHYHTQVQREPESSSILDSGQAEASNIILHGGDLKEPATTNTTQKNSGEHHDVVKPRAEENEGSQQLGFERVGDGGTSRTSCVNGPDKQQLDCCLPMGDTSDTAVLRSLIIPDSSMSSDILTEFFSEYSRQARAVLPWLPLCFGVIEPARAPVLPTSYIESSALSAKCGQAVAQARQSEAEKAYSKPLAGEIVMENLLSGMRKPAVVDVKLGTKYYGEKVTAAKREKEARYAQERGTHELGLAFCGYCCGSPFDKSILSLSGGSRASSDFKHPKTIGAFAELFETFLMLQGKVESAIYLGETFSRTISDLILLRRSMQNKPLFNFFGSSVLLIYDAGGEHEAHDTPDGETTHAASKTEKDMKVTAGAEGTTKENAIQHAKDTADRSTDPKGQGTAGETMAEAVRRSGVLEADAGSRQPSYIVDCKSEGHAHSTHCRKKAKQPSAAKCGKALTGENNSALNADEAFDGKGSEDNVGITSSRRSKPMLFRAKVRVVDFAHVIVLPHQNEEGFVFGLKNLQAALDLATRSLKRILCP